MNQLREEDLRPPVRDFFEKQNYTVTDEVKLFGRDIDIVAKRKSRVITVELKLYDWKRAIQQAYLNLRVADYSFIALPESVLGRISRKVYSEAYDSGIGLLCVDGYAKQIMKPMPSQRVQPILRRMFFKNLREKKDFGL